MMMPTMIHSNQPDSPPTNTTTTYRIDHLTPPSTTTPTDCHIKHTSHTPPTTTPTDCHTRHTSHTPPIPPTPHPSIPSFSNSDDFIGDRMSPHKPPNITRLYFVNVNGLRYGPQGGDFANICSKMASSHIDLLGLVETKLDTRLSYVVATCCRAARAVFPFSRVVLSSSAISYTKPFKPGGTALISVGSITGRITHPHHDHMGRWSSTLCN